MNLEWIGLGLALSKIRFTALVRRTPHSYGFEPVMYIRLKKICTEEQRKCIEVWAQANGFSLTSQVQYHGEKMNAILDALEPFFSLLNPSDYNNIKKIRWLQDNPFPKVAWRDDGTRRSKKIGKNWKKFMYWVEAWDAFCEELK